MINMCHILLCTPVGLTYKINEAPSVTEELGRRFVAQKIHDHITALRYLFLMLPPVYLKMLRELLELLHCITEHEQQNKMSAFNLGVMFAPHILWPRYVSIVLDLDIVNLTWFEFAGSSLAKMPVKMSAD